MRDRVYRQYVEETDQLRAECARLQAERDRLKTALLYAWEHNRSNRFDFDEWGRLCRRALENDK